MDDATNIQATAAACTRIANRIPGVDADDLVTRIGAKVDRRLARWDRDQVELELSVKDHDSRQQKVTLEAWIASQGKTHFVGTSKIADLVAAVDDAASDVGSQIGRFVDKRIATRNNG